MFGVTFGSGSFQPDMNFGNIDYLTYGLYPGDIFLIVMSIIVILGILGLGNNFSIDSSGSSSNPIKGFSYGKINPSRTLASGQKSLGPGADKSYNSHGSFKIYR